MAEWFDGWSVAAEVQPQPGDYPFDLDWVLGSVVALRARAPEDAFTAQALGVERVGHGVLIREDGIILTIGYLITEAEEVTLTTGDGRTVEGHVLGVDQTTGFGLVQALGPLAIPTITLSDAHHAPVGERVVVGGVGGASRSVAAHIVARQEFAGYWEYVLDEAIFTAPAHPLWSGAALIGPTGKLLGIGSLSMQHRNSRGRIEPLNMMVPIDLLPPIFDDLLKGGADLPGRPWLGVIAQDIEDRIVIAGTSGEGPARRAGLREGDIVLAVAGETITSLAGFYRSLWALGEPGVEAPLLLDREGDVFEVRVRLRDRRRFLKSARYN